MIGIQERNTDAPQRVQEGLK